MRARARAREQAVRLNDTRRLNELSLDPLGSITRGYLIAETCSIFLARGMNISVDCADITADDKTRDTSYVRS